MDNKEKPITVEELEDAIRRATKTIKICVPATGLNKMHGQFTTEELVYVDPNALIDLLNR